MKDIINKSDAEKDIKILNDRFEEWGNEWQEVDGDPSTCSQIAKMELILASTIATKYKGFIFNYKESEYENTGDDEWWEDQLLTENDIEELNITEENYGKADAVAFDLKEELVLYLKAELE